MKRRYAFIKIRSSHAGIDQVIRTLRHSFPEYELDIIDVKKILKRNLYVVVVNLFWMVSLYGIKAIIHSKSAFYNRFFGTPYIYHRIRSLLNKECQNDYAFSIQDCSLFNGKLVGTPHFVYTDHTVLANKNYPGYDEKRDMLSDSWISLEGDIYNDADLVFTLSQAVKRSVINDYGCDAKKVHCIYYAPFPEDIDRKPDARKYYSKNILFVGMEWERKGGPILIKAFEHVLQSVPDASLTIVGCKPEVFLPNVEVVGQVQPSELRAYYDHAAVFCLPTRREPFGIVFLEAMSYALPVVGTRIGALPEFIFDGDNGYLVNVDDAKSLARLLISLLTNPGECERLGLRGYDIYRETFTMDSVSESLKKLVTPFIRN